MAANTYGYLKNGTTLACFPLADDYVILDGMSLKISRLKLVNDLSLFSGRRVLRSPLVPPLQASCVLGLLSFFRFLESTLLRPEGPLLICSVSSSPSIPWPLTPDCRLAHTHSSAAAQLSLPQKQLSHAFTGAFPSQHFPLFNYIPFSVTIRLTFALPPQM